jgi:hypothetical protein
MDKYLIVRIDNLTKIMSGKQSYSNQSTVNWCLEI